ncbi:MAG: hypothetical protein OEY59_09680 [Deltaproteobacteria bacterium]|nr:hypothetical protein [Deltaproteobacteria bacterium]
MMSVKIPLPINASRVLLMAGVIFLIFSNAEACSVCYSNTEDMKWSFYISIIFMGLLPPSMVTGLAFWLYRRHKRAMVAVREN